jgi:hypothetical protein
MRAASHRECRIDSVTELFLGRFEAAVSAQTKLLTKAPAAIP